MRLLAKKRCRLVWNLVIDVGIGGGGATSAALPVSPVEDEQAHWSVVQR